jgi:hypothetical protein
MHIIQLTVRGAITVESRPIPGGAAPLDKPQWVPRRIGRPHGTPAGTATKPCGETEKEEKKTVAVRPLLLHGERN